MSTLNLTQAAELLKVHENTVTKLIAQGSFPAAKVGRAWVMLERDVLKYIENQIQQQTAERFGGQGRRRKIH